MLRQRWLAWGVEREVIDPITLSNLRSWGRLALADFLNAGYGYSLSVWREHPCYSKARHNILRSECFGKNRRKELRKLIDGDDFSRIAAHVFITCFHPKCLQGTETNGIERLSDVSY